MPNAEERSAAPRRRSHTGGVIIVIFLGLIFFAILGLLIFTTGRKNDDVAPAQSETLTVLAPHIRLRTEPNGKAPIVATASAGDKLTMLDDRGTWVRVQNTEGLVGWAERSLLERTAERERRLTRFAAIRKLPPLRGISNQRTVLYAGPGIYYPIIGELSVRTEVKVFTRDHDFYAIDFMDGVAYADVEAIDLTVTGTPQLNVSTSTSTTGTTETTESEPPPQTASSEPVPEETPQPAPEAVPPPPVPASSDRAGVYAAVPPGGTQPEEVDRVIPHYPPMARAAGVGGAVVIRGIVRRDGTIDNVQVLKDLPYGLGEAAREAVSQWRFRPATYRGEPIDVYYTVTVNFRLR